MTGTGMQERPERFTSRSNPSLFPFCCQKAGVRGRGEGEVQRSSCPVSGRKGDASACNTSVASFSPWETTWLEKGF